MKLKGRVGVVEEGQDIFLYQCPRCKSVDFSHNSGLSCKECADWQFCDCGRQMLLLGETISDVLYECSCGKERWVDKKEDK